MEVSPWQHGNDPRAGDVNSSRLGITQIKQITQKPLPPEKEFITRRKWVPGFSAKFFTKPNRRVRLGMHNILLGTSKVAKSICMSAKAYRLFTTKQRERRKSRLHSTPLAVGCKIDRLLPIQSQKKAALLPETHTWRAQRHNNLHASSTCKHMLINVPLRLGTFDHKTTQVYDLSASHARTFRASGQFAAASLGHGISVINVKKANQNIGQRWIS